MAFTKFCHNCGELLDQDRLYERHCCKSCRDADLPPEEKFGTLRLSETEMLDLAVVIVSRKADLLHQHTDRDLEDWEQRVWHNLHSIEQKIDQNLMRFNAQMVMPAEDMPPLRVLKGDKK